MTLNEWWAGEHVLAEADVVLVCHDGRQANPMHIVAACGPSRCILVLTNSVESGLDLSYVPEYWSPSYMDGLALVPRVCTRVELLWEISRIANQSCFGICTPCIQ